MANLSENVTMTTDSVDNYNVYTIGNAIWIYASPVLIVLGTVGNILSICVLQRRNLQRSTTMFYLMCLSVGDLCCLYTGLLRYWIANAFDKDIRLLSEFACKFHTFMVYQFLDFTVWVLVSVTVDRCMSVSFPFKSKQWFTIKRSKMVVLVIFLVAVVKNMHFVWTIEIVHTWDTRCDANSDRRHNFLKYTWPWIDLATFCLIPFTIMIICNIKIIQVMLSSRHNLKSYSIRRGGKTKPQQRIKSIDQPSTSCDTSNGMNENYVNVKTKPNSKKLEIPKREFESTVTASNTPKYRLSSLTAMLLTINCVFLITTSPIQVFLVGEEYWFAERTPEQNALYNFWWALVNCLQYLNNAIHFLLYCITGPRFRDELKAMFRRRNKVTIQIERSFTMHQ